MGYIFRIKDRKHYRVQAGAYENKAKAVERQKELMDKYKISSLIKEEDKMFKIQIGYYDGRENAEKRAAELNRKYRLGGFVKEI